MFKIRTHELPHHSLEAVNLPFYRGSDSFETVQTWLILNGDFWLGFGQFVNK